MPNADDGDEHDGDRADADRQRPAAGIVRVETDEDRRRCSSRCLPCGRARLASRSWSAIETCCANILNCELRSAPLLTSRRRRGPGHAATRNRRCCASAPTRACSTAPTPSQLDAAARSASTSVRCTPSGSVLTSSSNRCTISGRERCSCVDDLHARKQALALRFESVDLGDLLVELGDLVAQDLDCGLLRARPALDGELRQVDEPAADQHRARQRDEEIFLALLA